jgi:hypothetical protein
MFQTKFVIRSEIDILYAVHFSASLTLRQPYAPEWSEEEEEEEEMKTWGSGGIAQTFLTSALDGREWSVSRPGCFTPGESSLGTHWIGGYLGPRARWELWSTDKSLAPAGKSRGGGQYSYLNPSEGT